jgi:hypothetical protein
MAWSEKNHPLSAPKHVGGGGGGPGNGAAGITLPAVQLTYRFVVLLWL